MSIVRSIVKSKNTGSSEMTVADILNLQTGATSTFIDFTNTRSLYSDLSKTTLAVVNGEIAVAEDLSGNNLDWLQSNASNRGRLVNFAGSTALSINDQGRNEWYKLMADLTAVGSTSLFCDSGEEFTFFITCAVRDPSITGTVFSRCEASAREFQIMFDPPYPDETPLFVIRGSYIASGANKNTGDMVTIAVRWDGTSLHYWIDDLEYETIVSSSPGTSANNPSIAFALGARSAGNWDWFNGLIKNLLIVDKALPLKDAALIHSLLKS